MLREAGHNFAQEIKTKSAQHYFKSGQAVLVLFLSLTFLWINQKPLFTSAATTDELKQQQQQKQAELDQINKQIQGYQSQIATNLKQQNTLKNQISTYNAQIGQTTLQIRATQTQIDITGSQIDDLSQQIDEKEAKIAETKQQLAELIRQLYQLDQSNSTILALMNNDNLSDFLDQISQTESVEGSSYNLLQEIKTLKQQLVDQQSDLETQKKGFERLSSNLNDQKDALNDQVSSKNQLLTDTKGKEANYQKLLNQSQAQQDKIQKEMADLDAKIRTQLGDLASPGQHGVFAWPMKGILTQGYGNTGFTALGYSFHNGIDIYATPGTPITAPLDGTVIATGFSSTYAYGNWAAMKHDLPNGRQVITLYGHMKSVSVKTGQVLTTGDQIGTEGNTGNTTRLLYGPDRGYHLHFTVFDVKGFKIVPGAYGNYQIPSGYTYDPRDFL